MWGECELAVPWDEDLHRALGWAVLLLSARDHQAWNTVRSVLCHKEPDRASKAPSRKYPHGSNSISRNVPRNCSRQMRAKSRWTFAKESGEDWPRVGPLSRTARRVVSRRQRTPLMTAIKIFLFFSFILNMEIYRQLRALRWIDVVWEPLDEMRIYFNNLSYQ